MDLLMDERTRENWLKVKAALEAAGKTDSPFYARAVAVVTTGRDPGDGLKPLKF
jgi:hypothetical protein